MSVVRDIAGPIVVDIVSDVVNLPSSGFPVLDFTITVADATVVVGPSVRIIGYSDPPGSPFTNIGSITPDPALIDLPQNPGAEITSISWSDFGSVLAGSNDSFGVQIFHIGGVEEAADVGIAIQILDYVLWLPNLTSFSTASALATAKDMDLADPLPQALLAEVGNTIPVRLQVHESEPAVLPPVPATNITATANGTDTIDLDWDDVVGADSYRVERSADGSTGWTSMGTSATSYFSDTGLDEATQYFYRVIAINSGGESLNSAVVEDTTESLVPAEFTIVMRTTGASETVTLPATGNVDLDIDWGDGSAVESTTSDSPSHVYATADDYTIKITGSCDEFAFSGGGDKDKLLEVVAGGTGFNSGSWQAAFNGCGNCTQIDMAGADLTGTDGNLTSFARSTAATTIDLSAFSGFAATFLTNAFRTIGSVELIGVGDIDVTGIGPARYTAFALGSTIDTAGYDAILIGWEGQAVADNASLNFGSSTYSAGAAATARQALIDDHNWTITDGGPA